MNVAEAICRAVAIWSGYYVELDGYHDDMPLGDFRQLVATSRCPYPEEDGYPLDGVEYDWLNKPYGWFQDLDGDTAISYLSHLNGVVGGTVHDNAHALHKTLSECVVDVDTTGVGDWKPPEYKRPGKRLLAYLEDTTNLNSSARFVARVLLDHYSRENFAFPTQETLAHLTGCSVRTVRAALHALIDAKVIRVVRPYQYGDRYAPAVYDFTAKTKKAMQWE